MDCLNFLSSAKAKPLFFFSGAKLGTNLAVNVFMVFFISFALMIVVLFLLFHFDSYMTSLSEIDYLQL